jgi:hypothetical protein
MRQVKPSAVPAGQNLEASRKEPSPRMGRRENCVLADSRTGGYRAGRRWRREGRVGAPSHDPLVCMMPALLPKRTLNGGLRLFGVNNERPPHGGLS